MRQASKQPVLRTVAFLSVLALAASLLALLAIRAGQAPVSPTGAGASAKAGPADPSKEIERLKAQIKFLEIHHTFGPAVEVQKEDYAQARSQFHTKLLRQGPSPQRESPVKAPASVTEVEYRSGDLRLQAWVHRPVDQTRKHAAVLYLHGGFAFGMGDWDQYKPYRDAGFVVLAPILRAENGQPGAFSYLYDELDDVLAAAEYLVQQPYVDPKRLFVAGHSIGGNMTLLAAMASHRFRAAAAGPPRALFENGREGTAALSGGPCRRAGHGVYRGHKSTPPRPAVAFRPSFAQRESRAQCVQAALRSFNTPPGPPATISATSDGAKEQKKLSSVEQSELWCLTEECS